METADLRTLRSDRPGPSRRAPNPVKSIFIRDKRRHRPSEERPGYRLTAEAKIRETRETQPPAEECPRPPGAGRGKARSPATHPRAVRGSMALGHLDLGRLGPTLRKEAFRRLEPPPRAAACADLRQRLREGRAGARCPASPCPGQSRSPRVSFGVWTAAVPDDGGGSQPGWLVSLTQSVDAGLLYSFCAPGAGAAAEGANGHAAYVGITNVASWSWTSVSGPRFPRLPPTGSS